MLTCVSSEFSSGSPKTSHHGPRTIPSLGCAGFHSAPSATSL